MGGVGEREGQERVESRGGGWLLKGKTEYENRARQVDWERDIGGERERGREGER